MHCKLCFAPQIIHTTWNKSNNTQNKNGGCQDKGPVARTLSHVGRWSAPTVNAIMYALLQLELSIQNKMATNKNNNIILPMIITLFSKNQINPE